MKLLDAVIVDLPEICFAVLTLFGTELLPRVYAAGKNSREDLEDVAEFLSVWIVGLITGCRFVTSMLLTAIKTSNSWWGFWTVLSALFLLIGLYVFAKKSAHWFGNLGVIPKVSIRLVPLAFISGTIWLHTALIVDH